MFLGPKGLSLVKGVLDRRFGGRWSPTELDLISTYLYHISAAPALGEYSLNSLLEIVTTTDKMSKSDTIFKNDNKSTIIKNNSISADLKDNVTLKENKKDDKKPMKSKTFIYAREPLVDRLHELPKTLPILVLFGDNDWLYNPVDIINKNIKYLKYGVIKDEKNLLYPSPLTGISEINLKTNIEIIEKKSNDQKNSNPLNKTENNNFNGIDISIQIIPDAGHHIYLDNAKGFTYSITSWLKMKGLL